MLSGDSRHCWLCYFELLNKTQLREYEISVEANSKPKIRWRRKNKQVPAAVWAQTKESVTNMIDHCAVNVLSSTYPTEDAHSSLLCSAWFCRMQDGRRTPKAHSALAMDSKACKFLAHFLHRAWQYYKTG